jgi:hypothetical protein
LGKGELAVEPHGMNRRPAETLEQERWAYRTRGTVNRWSDELLGALPARANSGMICDMDAEYAVEPERKNLDQRLTRSREVGRFDPGA